MFKASGLELASPLNGGRDSLGSSRTHRFFSMIASDVVWHPNCSFALLARYSVSTRAPRRLAAGRVESKLRPVRVYHKVCFNLLMDPNVLQFVRRTDDFVKFVRK